MSINDLYLPYYVSGVREKNQLTNKNKKYIKY